MDNKIILTKVEILKYKCVEKAQSLEVESDITVLVGMNESGKTSILEALAKANYFESDEKFKYNLDLDYPRRQKKAMEKSGVEPNAVVLTYRISEIFAKTIENELGTNIVEKKFSITKTYKNESRWNINMVKTIDFMNKTIKDLQIKDKFVCEALQKINSLSSFDEALKIAKEVISEEGLTKINTMKHFFENKSNFSNPIDEYIVRKYLIPNIPKFIYYDDYYMLPSRVVLEEIEKNTEMSDSKKTAKALFELADIDVKKVINSNNYEVFISELESTQAIISDELFKYWTTNKNLEIVFQINKKGPVTSNYNQILQHILEIRVKNKRSSVTLPLENRSKGFNWFFSFLVWFMKIQENKDNTYILLLDEPGLNLHAKAQSDLLHFLSDLSKDYQIIYTTHSPFMIDSLKLHQVRTVVENENGSNISDSTYERDSNTLFPLQAALGYDIAQNLFISPKNLIVEGIADFLYLNTMSEILQSNKKNGLKKDITITPVGGADKVATFIALLHGNELDIVCLLDTFIDSSSRQRLENLIAQQIIKEKKMVFYHNIVETEFADIEDLFSKDDYIMLYNKTFNKDIKLSDLDKTKPILMQLKKLNDGKNFNHFLPASLLTKNVSNIELTEETLCNYEKLFIKLNKLF